MRGAERANETTRLIKDEDGKYRVAHDGYDLDLNFALKYGYISSDAVSKIAPYFTEDTKSFYVLSTMENITKTEREERNIKSEKMLTLPVLQQLTLPQLKKLVTPWLGYTARMEVYTYQAYADTYEPSRGCRSLEAHKLKQKLDDRAKELVNLKTTLLQLEDKQKLINGLQTIYTYIDRVKKFVTQFSYDKRELIQTHLTVMKNLSDLPNQSNLFAEKKSNAKPHSEESTLTLTNSGYNSD